MISIKQRGSFSKTEKLLKKSLGRDYLSVLDRYGKEGVEALASSTPVDTGLTSDSWKYSIIQNKDGVSIVWSNTNTNDGVNVAILLQYGHATRNGGYVSGIDYINPALKPVFDKLAESAWREITSV